MIVCQKHSALLQESEKQNYRSLTVYGAWLFQDDLKTFIFKILLQNASVKEKNPKCRKFDNVTEKKRSTNSHYILSYYGINLFQNTYYISSKCKGW